MNAIAIAVTVRRGDNAFLDLPCPGQMTLDATHIALGEIFELRIFLRVFQGFEHTGYLCLRPKMRAGTAGAIVG